MKKFIALTLSLLAFTTTPVLANDISTNPSIVTTEEIKYTPYTTEYIGDPNLEMGDEVIVTPGQKGKVVVYNWTNKDTGESGVLEKILSEPVTEVIALHPDHPKVTKSNYRVGTEQLLTRPFTIDYVADETVPLGQEVIDIPGVDEKVAYSQYSEYTWDGIFITSGVSETILTPMTIQIVRVNPEDPRVTVIIGGDDVKPMPEPQGDPSLIGGLFGHKDPKPMPEPQGDPSLIGDLFGHKDPQPMPEPQGDPSLFGNKDPQPTALTTSNPPKTNKLTRLPETGENTAPLLVGAGLLFLLAGLSLCLWLTTEER